MRIRILATGVALVSALAIPAIPASADDVAAPAPAATPSASAGPDDLGWGRTSTPTPASTPTAEPSGDLGWG